jgi:hypothetical protein
MRRPRLRFTVRSNQLFGEVSHYSVGKQTIDDRAFGHWTGNAYHPQVCRTIGGNTYRAEHLSMSYGNSVGFSSVKRIREGKCPRSKCSATSAKAVHRLHYRSACKRFPPLLFLRLRKQTRLEAPVTRAVANTPRKVFIARFPLKSVCQIP